MMSVVTVLKFIFCCIPLLTAGVAANRHQEVIPYISQLAQELHKEMDGVVWDCWLLQFSNEHEYSALQDALAQSLNTQYVNLLQASRENNYLPSTVRRDPSLVVILLGSKPFTKDDHNIFQWIVRVPIDCKTLVLGELAPDVQLLQNNVVYLTKFRVWNVALIAMDMNYVFTINFRPFAAQSHAGFPGYSVIFYDRLKTLEIKSIRAFYKKDMYTVGFCTHVPGEDIALLQLFAQTLNVELDLVELHCSDTESLGSCTSKLKQLDVLMNRYLFHRYNKFSVSCMAMEQIAIATPAGRLLTIWEMLLKPFQQPVWWVIIVLCVSFELVDNIAPNWFSNSMVGLALFGFEKRQLRFTRPTEKLVAGALIVMFFLLKCGYEAKLISYITQTPREADALSIQDLRDRNITVYHRKFDTTPMDKLRGMVAKHQYDRIVLDGLTIMENRDALRIHTMFNDVNPDAKLAYTILEENVLEILPFYTFHQKTLFRQPFIAFQHKVFEAGLPFHWRQENFRCNQFYKQAAPMNNQQMGNLIRLENFKPLVLFFCVQWAFELIVFVVEVIVGRIRAR